MALKLSSAWSCPSFYSSYVNIATVRKITLEDVISLSIPSFTPPGSPFFHPFSCSFLSPSPFLSSPPLSLPSPLPPLPSFPPLPPLPSFPPPSRLSLPSPLLLLFSIPLPFLSSPPLSLPLPPPTRTPCSSHPWSVFRVPGTSFMSPRGGHMPLSTWTSALEWLWSSTQVTANM